jgi:hypothetical protein
MSTSGFEPPIHPFDAESKWLQMQIAIQKRISNPPDSILEDYLKPHLSQDEWNFICEMGRIKDDYSEWIATHNIKINPPYVFTDVKILDKWRRLTSIRFKALGEEIARSTASGELAAIPKKTPKESRFRDLYE